MRAFASSGSNQQDIAESPFPRISQISLTRLQFVYQQPATHPRISFSLDFTERTYAPLLRSSATSKTSQNRRLLGFHKVHLGAFDSSTRNQQDIVESLFPRIPPSALTRFRYVYLQLAHHRIAVFSDSTKSTYAPSVRLPAVSKTS